MRLLVAAAMLLLLVAARSHAAPGGLVVTVDRTAVATRLGDSFSFQSTVTNNGPTEATGLVAQLDVLSLRSGVYVDPEDWSSERTRYLPAIPPGGSVSLTWRIKAVDSGSLGVFVAIVRGDGENDTPVTAPTLALTVADRRSLDAGGILPLALGVPAAILGLLLVSRVRRITRRG